MDVEFYCQKLNYFFYVALLVLCVIALTTIFYRNRREFLDFFEDIYVKLRG